MADDKDIARILEDLFEVAKSNGKMEYLYTLVRVDGITNTPDPLIGLRRILDALGSIGEASDHLPKYRELTSTDEPLALVANLLNCARGLP